MTPPRGLAKSLDLAGMAQDQVWSYTYNAACQVKTEVSDNSLYNWAPAAAVSRSYTINGLNQAVTAGAASLGYDGRGNLANDGATGFTYDLDNRLVSASGASAATLSYDPLGRLGHRRDDHHYSVCLFRIGLDR